MYANDCDEADLIDLPDRVKPCIQSLRDIVSNKQCATFEWDDGVTLVDGVTANLLIKVFDSLTSEKARENFIKFTEKSSMTFMKVVDIAWSGVR